MRPAFGGFGGFGGGGLKSTSGKLAVAVVVGSVLWALGRTSGLATLITLSPHHVLDALWLWQPLTYVVIATHPISVIFTVLIAYGIGGALEQTWGSRRLLWVALGYPALAGVLTVLLALVLPELRAFQFGGAPVMLTVLWVAFGWSWGRGQTGFWGLPMTGNQLALLGIGFVLLRAVFESWLVVVPELFGVLVTFVAIRLGHRLPAFSSPRIWWLRFQHRRLERQLKGRSRHLRVVSRDDEPPRRDYLN